MKLFCHNPACFSGSLHSMKVVSSRFYFKWIVLTKFFFTPALGITLNTLNRQMYSLLHEIIIKQNSFIKNKNFESYLLVITVQEYTFNLLSTVVFKNCSKCDNSNLVIFCLFNQKFQIKYSLMT